MKNDSSRLTFDPRKHFGSVRMQQGRVQIDADGNEQNDIFTHRIETEAGDVIGLCGAPMHYPAFHIVGGLRQLSTGEQALPGNRPVPAGFKLPDFLISAGRYYVDGILCENEQLTSYLNQPDLPDAPPIIRAGLYLIYVDVWQRLLTTLDDPSIREIALGGPDTAARVKTVWQVKQWFAGTGTGNCLTKFDEFERLIAPSDGTLSARTKPGPPSSDPCIVPPGAGYLGLENQLYRIEIHDGGSALDATTAGTLADRVEGKVNQISVTGSWRAGQAVEVFAGKSDDPRTGTLAYITNVESENDLETRKPRRITRTKKKVAEIGSKILTLDTDVSKIALDELYVRPATATFKWSRDNGVVVTAIQSIDGQKVTVHDLGRDDALGFKIGQWVEISDDGLELNGRPGQLARIAGVDSAINLITLNIVATPLDASQPSGVNEDRHPKLRRWDGVGAVKFVAGDYFLDLESGVQVRFSDQGSVRTGDYWTIAARTATADTQSGNIEWPRDGAGEPVEQLPFGIKHHYCRLAMLHLATASSIELSTTEKTVAPEKSDDIEEIGINSPATRFDRIEDCRHLFPPITELTSLLYVNGAGQESMPTQPQPQALQAGVFNGRWAVADARVRFTASDNGRLSADISGLPNSMAAPSTTPVTVSTGPDGVASCSWILNPNGPPSQQVEARLLDAGGNPLAAIVRFDGNLSIAAQVAYNPGACGTLQNQGTVQKALSRLSQLSSLYKISGDGQEIMPGETVAPLKVLVASPCGVSEEAEVTFEIVKPGKGTVGNGVTFIVTKRVDGFWTCNWKPDLETSFQEVEASIKGDATTPPVTVRFSLNLSKADHVSYNPNPKDCPDLAKAKVTTVQAALDELCKRGKPQEEPGIRITEIRAGFLGGKPQPLLNDTLVPVSRLVEGVTIVCDKSLASAIGFGGPQTSFPIVAPKPTCFVTLDLPSPLPFEQKLTGNQTYGFNPVILACYVMVVDKEIRWVPTPSSLAWLQGLFGQGSVFNRITDRVLAHLTLKGKFIVSSGPEPEMWLDGEAFAFRNATRGDLLNLGLDSGDKRRGGDFEMWFWLFPGLILQVGASPGVITGTVVNHAGSGVPNSTVTATHTATGQTAKTVTDDDGNFKLQNLQKGPYQVNAKLGDFSAFREVNVP